MQIVGGSGTLVQGNTLRDNLDHGVEVENVGATIRANTISGNGLDGVEVGGVGVRITENSILNNGSSATELGIDLSLSLPTPTDGVSANYVGDGDTGPNNLQNFPVLTGASVSGGSTVVSGTLDSVAGVTYTG